MKTTRRSFFGWIINTIGASVAGAVGVAAGRSAEAKPLPADAEFDRRFERGSAALDRNTARHGAFTESESDIEKLRKSIDALSPEDRQILKPVEVDPDTEWLVGPGRYDLKCETITLDEACEMLRSGKCSGFENGTIGRDGRYGFEETMTALAMAGSRRG